MGTEEYRKVLLTRVRKVTPWNAEAIVSHIMTSHTHGDIENYVNGSDAALQALIEEAKKSVKPRAQSPGREFPAPSWKGQSSDTFDGIQAASVGQIGTSQLPGSSSIPDGGVCDFLNPSWNSQGQSSNSSVGFQVASAVQIGASQLPGLSSIPDDGVLDFPNPSWNSQGQSSNSYVGFQAASAGQIGASQLPGSSSIPDDGVLEFLPPSWNSQGQPSETSEGIQAPPAGQIGISQLPGSSSIPDDGMRDFPDPSWNSQGQSSGTSMGFQSAPAGQIVTSQIPGDESIGLKEHSQSSSVPGCSNVTRCLPRGSRPWPDTCHFYISRRGLCKKGLSCEFSHGFGPSGKFEMEIRQLLKNLHAAVSVEDLPWIYLELYNKHLPLPSVWDPSVWDARAVPSLLQPLHTICWIPGSDERHFLVLVEHSESYLGYSDHLHKGPNTIYISFSAASRSICTINVHDYFSQYGPVMYVTLPYHRSFGFVRFQYPETVRLLLSEWNPQIPHFISGAAVYVRRYLPKGEAKLKNSMKQGLENSQASHSHMEINLPEGSPDRDSADHDQPSHSQVEIDHPEVLLGGQVPDGLGVNPVEDAQADGLQLNPVEGAQVPGGLQINPVEGAQADGLQINHVEGGEVPGGLDGNPADEQIDDEMVQDLPDVSCFYEQT